MFGFDFGGFFLLTLILGVVLPLVITVLVVVVIIFAIRRAMPTGKNAAEMELQQRLVSGQIDPAEYQARVDALKQEQ
jgi:uncharacterized membrane protein